ncbi:MAG: hypothetical protein K2K57_03325 [Oscillospiraceae bacterium]|nr:hypothetical protein [Oscillospiraceae bacterium]
MGKLTLEEIERLPREYITVKEAADVMGISFQTFYSRYNEMPFPVLRVGRNFRVLKAPFIEYMRTGRTDADR